MDLISGNNRDHINLNSIGRPFAGVDVKIDPVVRIDLPIANSQTGEILVKADSLFKKYWVVEKDPKKPNPTKAAFTPDGYYHTGDCGKIDENGFVSFGVFLSPQLCFHHRSNEPQNEALYWPTPCTTTC